jgi:hypothetical protein
MAQLKNTTISSTAAVQLPVGTTAQRPSSVASGYTRYNSTLNQLELYNGIGWININSQISASVTGSVYTGDIVDGETPYRVHVFTGSGSFTPSIGGEVEYLIVAGGGGVGGDVAGGAGAGGLLQGTVIVTPQTYTITVGGGGAGAAVGSANSAGGTSGQNSSAFGLTAIGGGYAASINRNSLSGGSGGGGTYLSFVGAAGTEGQGYSGGTGGSVAYVTAGGGGSGAPGSSASGNDAGVGGIGRPSSITGTTVFYAGGGGGGSSVGNLGAPGGLGGGGPGKDRTTIFPGWNGAPNTGGGGGGNAHPHYGGANGGSGIVVVRYKINSGKTSPKLSVSEGLVFSLDPSDLRSFRYNENTTTCYDSVYNLTGTLETGVNYSNDRSGIFTFNGSSKISVPNSTRYKIDVPMTVAIWFRFDGTSTEIFSNDQFNCGENGYSPVIYSGLNVSVGSTGFTVNIGNNGGCGPSGRQSRSVSATVTSNVWHHLVLSIRHIQGSGTRFYFNGNDLGTPSESGTGTHISIGYSAGPMSIGARVSNVSYLNGAIGSVKIYDHAFGDVAAKQNFEAERGRFGV